MGQCAASERGGQLHDRFRCAETGAPVTCRWREPKMPAHCRIEAGINCLSDDGRDIAGPQIVPIEQRVDGRQQGGYPVRGNAVACGRGARCAVAKAVGARPDQGEPVWHACEPFHQQCTGSVALHYPPGRRSGEWRAPFFRGDDQDCLDVAFSDEQIASQLEGGERRGTMLLRNGEREAGGADNGTQAPGRRRRDMLLGTAVAEHDDVDGRGIPTPRQADRLCHTGGEPRQICITRDRNLDGPGTMHFPDRVANVACDRSIVEAGSKVRPPGGHPGVPAGWRMHG
ncbi:protein of unknown function [Paraburkholderia kururiensis]